jgi:hypothetical protein
VADWKYKNNRAGRSTVLEENDVPDAPTATGQYPDPVWSSSSAMALEDQADDVPEPPTATGQYPGPVWDTSASSQAQGLVLETFDLDSSKDANFTDELPVGALPETSTPAPSFPLDNREIYRIVREVTYADSGDDLYSAVEYQDNFGLCFGLALFAQSNGQLGAVLRLMSRRDPAAFRQAFGPEFEELLAVTSAPKATDRLKSVGGEPLWSDRWMERFRGAAGIPAFQAAQNEYAIEGQFRPMLRAITELGLTTDRGLAMAYDRVVICGVGGAIGWIVGKVGSLVTAAERTHALENLGFADLKQFQASTDWVPQNGVFNALTHAALMGALRRKGAIPMPSPADCMSRMLESASGAPRSRLLRLRVSEAFEDVAYQF